MTHAGDGGGIELRPMRKVRLIWRDVAGKTIFSAFSSFKRLYLFFFLFTLYCAYTLFFLLCLVTFFPILYQSFLIQDLFCVFILSHRHTHTRTHILSLFSLFYHLHGLSSFLFHFNFFTRFL